ncbi:hypothetical protein GBF38_001941, partial [Nibea albiflora]
SLSFTDSSAETDRESSTDNMSTSTISPSRKQERKGSFFKLIDSFAWEIGTLKKEMGNKTEPAEGDHNTDTLLGPHSNQQRAPLKRFQCCAL